MEQNPYKAPHSCGGNPVIATVEPSKIGEITLGGIRYLFLVVMLSGFAVVVTTINLVIWAPNLDALDVSGQVLIQAAALFGLIVGFSAFVFGLLAWLVALSIRDR